MMKLTPGKLKGMKAVSDSRGVIAAAAMDQRGSLQKSLAKEKGSEITDAMMEEFKSIVTAVLTEHAAPSCSIRSGDCRLLSAAPITPDFYLPTRRPATTRPVPGVCLTCSTTGRCGD